jgi:hypothetical protein
MEDVPEMEVEETGEGVEAIAPEVEPTQEMDEVPQIEEPQQMGDPEQVAEEARPVLDSEQRKFKSGFTIMIHKVRRDIDAIQEQYTEGKKKCLELKNAGNIEEAKQMLRQLKEWQAKLDDLKAQLSLESTVVEHHPTEAHSSEVPEQSSEVMLDDHQQVSSRLRMCSHLRQEQLLEIATRMEEFKEKALQAKKKGNTDLAKQLLLCIKQLKAAETAINGGHQIGQES